MYSDRPAPNHPGDLHWQQAHHYSASQLPASVRHWLLDQGSLTQRLIAASSGQLQIKILHHHWQRPRASEARLLGMAHRELAIVREVTLQCHQQPWVFARSVIPASAISGRLRRLRTFSDSSLGSMLFSEPGMRRQPFQVARIPTDYQLPIATTGNEALWGRRCRFELAGKAIMVSEIFLPDFTP